MMENYSKESVVIAYKDGQSCGHTGCANHVTHPCEGCGRKGAVGEATVTLWKKRLAPPHPDEEVVFLGRIPNA